MELHKSYRDPEEMARKGDYTIRCVTAVLLGMGRTGACFRSNIRLIYFYPSLARYEMNMNLRNMKH